uniref:Uncharacterized protein n=1 Tax=Arundo donax TaxID=35708 RepID=A0A0A9HBT1_ARUDO
MALPPQHLASPLALRPRLGLPCLPVRLPLARGVFPFWPAF